MLRAAALLSLLALAPTGARELGTPALAPAAWSPAAAGSPLPKSDLTFVLTADKATFKTDSLLKFSSTAKAVPYFTSNRVSSMPIGAFANGAPGSPLVSSEGLWLDAPQALLYGSDAAGNVSSVALTLQGVRYYNESGSLKFNVTVVPAQTASLKLRDGPVSTAITDSKQGTGPNLATAVKADMTWTAVTLVVESTRTALKQPAETKTFGLFWGGPWGWNRGWGGGWGGNGWGGCGWGGCGWGK